MNRWKNPGTILASAFLPGALAGTQIAGLLFFLNPHLPFDFIPVLRGVAFFSVLLGGLGILALTPFTWANPERARRLLPWSLTLVLAAAAIGSWIHASYFAFFLPSGINRRLLKAAIWLSLAAVVCFYTALIHRVRQRPYGRRTRILFVLMALASVYVMMERREAFKPELGPGPRATTFAGSPRPQLVVVGLETATLDAILPLAEQGRLPFFGKILAEGSHARLTGLFPSRREPLWTTLASGKYPFQHGVVGESVFDARFLDNEFALRLLPLGIGFDHWGIWSSSRPVDSSDRQVLALWEILARLDISTALVGWPLAAARDGLPQEGVEVGLTDHFFKNGHGEREVWPAEMAERARLFRTRPEDLEPELRSKFGADPPAVVLEAQAADLWREDLALFLLEQDPQIDAFFVLLPGLREISKSFFGGYSAVQFEGLQHPASQEAAQLLAAYYTQLDDFLSRLWERCRQPRLLVVVSAHGVEDAPSWRKALHFLRRKPPMAGYTRRAPDGVLMFLGDGIRAEPRVGSAEPVDLVPTLLYGLGFPIARDLDGAVLTQAFETTFLARQPLSFLPSYETFTDPEGKGEAP